MNSSLLSRVLIPLDGSSESEIILPELHRLLPRHVSSWTLLQALDLFHLPSEAEAEDYLRRTAVQLTREGHPSKYVLRHGPAAETILQAAAAEHSTLIALATHGRSGVDRWMLGSVAENLLQTSPVPVLMVRGGPSTPSPSNPKSRPIRSVLLPLDGSPQALEVLTPILALARGIDARVRILEVDDPDSIPGHWETPDAAAKQADGILRDACIPTTFERRRGNAAEEILKSVQDHGIDLIAMTTHGRSGPPRWILGSVTAEILRHTLVPLLVVRHCASKNAKNSPPEANISTPVDSPG